MPRPAELTFELMRTFLAVVDAGGRASPAARQLGIGQPSIKRRLDHFREGGPVLTRPWLVQVGKRCVLTEEGQRVLPAVRELVQGYDNLRTFVARPPQVAFACGEEESVTFVHQAVTSFNRRRRPAILHISQLPGPARIEGVANGSLDLAAVTDDEATVERVARRPLFTEVLAADPLLLVAARGAPGAEALAQHGGKPLGPRDLARLEAPLIVPGPDAGARQVFDQALRQAGVLGKVRVQLEVGGWAAVLSYVGAGLGVGLVSQDVMRRWAGAASAVTAALDRRAFAPAELRLIARRRTGDGARLDLSADGGLFLEDLRAAARAQFGEPAAGRRGPGRVRA